MIGEQSCRGQGVTGWHLFLEQKDYVYSWLVYAENASKSLFEFFDKFAL